MMMEGVEALVIPWRMQWANWKEALVAACDERDEIHRVCKYSARACVKYTTLPLFLGYLKSPSRSIVSTAGGRHQPLICMYWDLWQSFDFKLPTETEQVVHKSRSDSQFVSSRIPWVLPGYSPLVIYPKKKVSDKDFCANWLSGKRCPNASELFSHWVSGDAKCLVIFSNVLEGFRMGGDRGFWNSINSLATVTYPRLFTHLAGNFENHTTQWYSPSVRGWFSLLWLIHQPPCIWGPFQF